ncbi:MAG: diguanylate cyclase [Candidatus Acidulodesulfobacterium sp.]
MNIIKNKVIYVLGALFFITALTVAASIWRFGLIPLKHYVVYNTKLYLKFMEINRNIEHLKTKTLLIVYYEKVKPLNYSNKLKQTLNETKILIYKTGSEYKNAAAFIKKTAQYADYDPEIVKTFRNSYFRWETINKPIFKRFIKYPGYVAPGISFRLFSEYALSLSSSVLPSKKLAEESLSRFENIVSVYFFIFILGTFIIVILGILLTYYFDKLFNAVKENEQRLKTFFNKLPIPSLIIDTKTDIIIDVNEKAAEFYGYSKDEFRQMTISAINPFMSTEEKINFRAKALKKGNNFAIFKHKLKNGSIRDVEANISGVIYDNKPYIQEIIKDITEKKLLEDKLKESEELFRTLADNMPVGIDMHKDRFIYVNPALQDMLGYTEDELKNMFSWDIFAEEYKEEAKKSIKEGLSDIRYKHYVTFKAIKKTGEELWVYIYADSVKYKGEIVRIASYIDITEMMNLKIALEHERDLFKVLIENINSGIAFYNKDKFIYVNSALLDLFHYTKEEFLNLNVNDFFSIEEDQLYQADSSVFKMHYNNEPSSRFIYKVKDNNIKEKTAAGIRYIDLFRTEVTYNNEQTGLAIFSDVTNQVLKEQSILVEKETYKELSEHDALTGINNRRFFDDKLVELLNIALRYNRPLSLIMFDIDHFKSINDTYGHETGDIILKEISSIVKESLRTTDFFARYGGEEFMVIAPETPLKTALELAKRLRYKIEKHDFNIGQSVTCSFGITEVKDNDTSQSIIHRADGALYEAKDTGRNKVCTDNG